MKERPIIFSGPMVRAILEERKTMTRRVVKPQPEFIKSSGRWAWDIPKSKVQKGCCTAVYTASREWWEYLTSAQFPYAPGDRLWMRENWTLLDANHKPVTHSLRGLNHLPIGCNVVYQADHMDPKGDGPDRIKWRPSIHMPRWASRLTLEVIDIRVERLKDVTEKDARAEGARWKDLKDHGRTGWSMEDPLPASNGSFLPTAKMAFANYINKIHGGENWNLKPSCLWDENPWVWVVIFKRANK